MGVGIRCADHVTPSTRKSRNYFTDSGGHLVGIVRLRTKATEFSFFLVYFPYTTTLHVTNTCSTVYLTLAILTQEVT
jgi:hypothetical protein